MMVRRRRKWWLQRKARSYRKKLRKISDAQWIGVTGSCGKSTTTRLLAHLLGKKADCPLPNEAWNYTGTVPLAILSVQPTQDFVVQEIGTHVPGTIAKLCEMIQPDVGVVMNVGTDHYSMFKGIEGIAHEKADLVRALGPENIVVLNVDDVHVSAMAKLATAKVVTFGVDSQADFRAMDVSSQWPEPLSFNLVHKGARYPVSTILHGKHLAPNVLAAMAAACSVGLEIDDVVQFIKDAEPVSGRMSEVRAADGVTFIRDDFKAPWWGIPLAIEFLDEAIATRKIAVLGEMSDNPGNKGRKFRRLVKSAAEVADLVVIVGAAAGELNQQLKNAENIKAVATVSAAREFLAETLVRGDLVLLKGMLADHLERLAWAHTTEVGCWRERCRRNIPCSKCDLMAVPAESGDPLP